MNSELRRNCATCAHCDYIHNFGLVCARDSGNLVEISSDQVCPHWRDKTCRDCGHYFDPFGDCANIALCTCYEKSIDDDFVEIPKDKKADGCESYHYDPQEEVSE